MFQICHIFNAIFDIILQTIDQIIKDNGINGVNGVLERALHRADLAMR